MEDDLHRVAGADDGIWLAGSTVFRWRNRSVGDLNVVISAGGMGLQSKGLESEFDLLSFGDLQVPGLIMVKVKVVVILLCFAYLVQVVRINIGIVWRLDHSY